MSGKSKFKPYFGWLAVGIAFVTLTALVGTQAKPQETQWTTGNAISAQLVPNSEAAIRGVRGTVDRVTTKSTGERTIHMIADDGAPISVVVMPTVDIAIPHTTDRISVEGSILTTGVLILNDSKSLMFLAPAFTQINSRRQHWIGKLVNRERIDNGGHWCTMESLNGTFIGKTFVQKDVSLIGHPNNQCLDMDGYVGTDGTLVIESILTVRGNQ